MTEAFLLPCPNCDKSLAVVEPGKVYCSHCGWKPDPIISRLKWTRKMFFVVRQEDFSDDAIMDGEIVNA